MKIQIAGPGCPRCQATEQNVFNACAQLNLPADISHVYDVREYAKLGVMMTPAVIVDGKIVVSGRVPTVEELKRILSEIKPSELRPEQKKPNLKRQVICTGCGKAFWTDRETDYCPHCERLGIK